MSKSMRDRIRFFQKHAGYCTPPGRMACAKQSALIEEWAEAIGVTFQWEQDYECDLGDHAYWCAKAKKGEECEHECEQVAAFLDGECIGSLCGIIDADDNYRRVVQAEIIHDEYRERKREAAYMAV